MLGGLIVMTVLNATPAVEGTFEGKGGLPVRDTSVTFRGQGDEATAEWKDSDGRGGKVQVTWKENEARLVRDGFSCTLVFAADGASFQGTCHEQLGAEARAPMSYEWVGTRKVPAPARKVPRGKR